MSTRKVFDLSAHRDPVAGVIRVNGTDHHVLKFNGLQYQRVQLLNDASPVTDIYDLVRDVVPSLSEEERLAFTKDDCSHVLIIAGQGIAAVEKLFPNGESPEGLTSPG